MIEWRQPTLRSQLAVISQIGICHTFFLAHSLLPLFTLPDLFAVSRASQAKLLSKNAELPTLAKSCLESGVVDRRWVGGWQHSGNVVVVQQLCHQMAGQYIYVIKSDTDTEWRRMVSGDIRREKSEVWRVSVRNRSNA